jgi:hypothetical protein
VSGSLAYDPLVLKALQPAGRQCIPAKYIDYNIIRAWLKGCTSIHSRCRMTRNGQGRRQGWAVDRKGIFKVIDVEENEVVIAPPSCEYVALSYVWGKVTAH